MKVTLNLNGKKINLETFPMARLLDVLREHLLLTGTKEGCGEGECGACSVFVDEKLVNSCLVPMVQVDGASVTTIEGLKKNGMAVQKAFLKCGGAQCGICTPGMIMATCDLLSRRKNPNQKEMAEALSGNLCRCTGYTRIFKSVKEAAKNS